MDYTGYVLIGCSVFNFLACTISLAWDWARYGMEPDGDDFMMLIAAVIFSVVSTIIIIAFFIFIKIVEFYYGYFKFWALEKFGAGYTINPLKLWVKLLTYLPGIREKK